MTKEARVERGKREKGKEAETSSGVMPEAEARDSVTVKWSRQERAKRMGWIKEDNFELGSKFV